MVNADFPFRSHFFTTPAGKMHYLDEGQGSPVVMVHGNPTWSYYYRNLARALSPFHRCIVPDHLGCGLSDKPQPPQYGYSLQERVIDFTNLMNHLDVREKITLVVHDWGGMIGLAWAKELPVEAIERLVILNTAGFGLPEGMPLPWRLKLGRNTRLGAWLIRSRNLFCLHAASIGTKRKRLDPQVRENLLRPYRSWEDRIAILKFVQTIPLGPQDAGWEIVQAVKHSLNRYRSTPTRIYWGMKDFVFTPEFLAEWRRQLPEAVIQEFADCGHYILEDAAEEIIPDVVKFLEPLRSSS